MSTRISYSEREAHGVRFGELQLSSDNGINPMSGDIVRQIRSRLAAMDDDAAPHALLLSATGRCFCAGADVKEFRAFNGAAFENYMSEILAMYMDMIEAARPILCIVQADARGAGAALALCSDFVVATDSTRFALPESHRGLAGGGYLMPRLIGRQRAAEMVILGRDYTATQMLDMGLVNHVEAPENLPGRVDSLCAELATIPVSAFRVAKQSLGAGLSVGLRDAMRCHVQAQTEAFAQARAQGLV